MRIRTVAAIALLALPATLSAQRLPRGVFGRGVGRAEPPPMALAIARQMSYRRMHFSIESYPVVNFVEAPPSATGVAHWTSYGGGTRADYRLNRFVSATFDVTSTILGGPAETQTAELGTRLHRERTESRAYPFLDFRVGYLQSYNNFFPAIDGIAIPGSRPGGSGFRYSRGFGAITGGGMEYALTRRFSVTSGAFFMRSNVMGYGYSGAMPARNRYMMNMYRITMGIRFNPVRMVTASSPM